ncbi:MAG: hypothetical protein ACE5FL_11975 [Myxococcota bacterium]
MITGSNTNVQYRGKLFHVQTEDSGRRNPHVISHLYYGGTILASHKTTYDDLLDLASDTLDQGVRALIEEQHIAMLKRLKCGDFDAVIDQRIDAAAAGDTSPDTDPDTAPTIPPESAAESSLPPPTQPALGSPDRPRPTVAAAEEAPAFGDSVDSAKPLDEVILDYLVEKARHRARDRGENAADRLRKKG